MRMWRPLECPPWGGGEDVGGRIGQQADLVRIGLRRGAVDGLRHGQRRRAPAHPHVPLHGGCVPALHTVLCEFVAGRGVAVSPSC